MHILHLKNKDIFPRSGFWNGFVKLFYESFLYFPCELHVFRMETNKKSEMFAVLIGPSILDFIM